MVGKRLKKALELKNITVSVNDKPVVHGVSLDIGQGEVHSLMGPNGSGKSSLAFGAAGHPRYIIMSGDIKINGKKMTNASPDERARQGLFLSFQHPAEIDGISGFQVIKTSVESITGKKVDLLQFRKDIEERAGEVGLDPKFLYRPLNKGFSGGEKKRMEILQLLLIKPVIAILDEADSGLDIDALKAFGTLLKKFAKKEHIAFLIITHYQRMLKTLQPDRIHVMMNGAIVRSGGPSLSTLIEKNGYQSFYRHPIMKPHPIS